MNDHTVKVIETIDRTVSAASVRMEKPEGFEFLPGQWASFSIDCDGENISKPLSFSSSPTEPFLEFTKKKTGSAFCRGIEKLQPGSEVRFHGPLGRMFYREGMADPVFMAGGIGITPVRSMLKFIHDKEIDGPRTLFYANRSREEAAFRREFEEMAAVDDNFTITWVYEDPPPGWTGATGFITLELLRKHFPDPAGHTWFLCGPPAMVNFLMKDLDELGIDRDSLQYEKLEGYEGFV